MGYKFVVFATSVFLLNFFWESWHAVYLYQGHAGQSFFDFTIKDYLALITYVSVIDALMLAAVFLISAAIWRDLKWFAGLNLLKAAGFILLALAFAIFIEIKGVYIMRQWSYSDLMPVVFGLGLSPLLQLPITGLISLWLIKEK